jgi:histidyl-tRNA synthetase
LLESFGSPESVPAVGFGFGDAVISELLDSLGLLPPLQGRQTEVVVYAASISSKQTAIECVSNLRSDGIISELILGDKKIKWALQRADKLQSGL